MPTSWRSGTKLCDLVGQARVAGINGDPWQLSLGAFFSGMAALKVANWGARGRARLCGSCGRVYGVVRDAT